MKGGIVWNRVKKSGQIFRPQVTHRNTTLGPYEEGGPSILVRRSAADHRTQKAALNRDLSKRVVTNCLLEGRWKGGKMLYGSRWKNELFGRHAGKLGELTVNLSLEVGCKREPKLREKGKEKIVSSAAGGGGGGILG